MSGFFKKFADAFVEVEPEASDLSSSVTATHSAEELDVLTADASELMSRLGGNDETTSVQEPPLAESPESLASGNAPTGSSGSGSSVLAMRMSAEQVFEQAGILDGTNSAQRILKLIGGLSMFPREQQVVMLKAMDAADDTWTEEDVLCDARNRQSALRNHLKRIDAEKDEFLGLLDAEISDKKTAGDKVIADIDAEIANLHDQREAAIVEMTNSTKNLQHQKAELIDSTKSARRGLTEEINAFSNLISFFNATNSSPTK